MAQTGVFAPRYAHAFASVAAEKKLDLGAARSQMKDFSGTLAESQPLREILADPSVPIEQKLSVIDAICERIGALREVRNFIAVIMDHQRLAEFDLILAAYDQVVDTDEGVTEAEVTSVHPLHDEDRVELERQVERLAATRVRVSYSLDPELLGGAVIRIGSTVYDGSVRTQLDQMKQALVTA